LGGHIHDGNGCVDDPSLHSGARILLWNMERDWKYDYASGSPHRNTVIRRQSVGRWWIEQRQITDGDD
jgi:hypothetical protein